MESEPIRSSSESRKNSIHEIIRSVTSIAQNVIAILALVMVYFGYRKIEPIIVHQIEETSQDATVRSAQQKSARIGLVLAPITQNTLDWWNQRVAAAEAIVNEYGDAGAADKKTKPLMYFSRTDSGAVAITVVSRIGPQNVRIINFDVPSTHGDAGSYIINLAENGPYLRGLEQTERDQIVSKIKTFVENDPFLKKVVIGEPWSNPSVDEVVKGLSKSVQEEPYKSDVERVRKSIRKLDIDLGGGS